MHLLITLLQRNSLCGLRNGLAAGWKRRKSFSLNKLFFATEEKKTTSKFLALIFLDYRTGNNPRFVLFLFFTRTKKKSARGIFPISRYCSSLKVKVRGSLAAEGGGNERETRCIRGKRLLTSIRVHRVRFSVSTSPSSHPLPLSSLLLSRRSTAAAAIAQESVHFQLK